MQDPIELAERVNAFGKGHFSFIIQLHENGVFAGGVSPAAPETT